MGMILYHGEPNGPSLAVLAALAESGVDADCRPIDLLATTAGVEIVEQYLERLEYGVYA